MNNSLKPTFDSSSKAKETPNFDLKIIMDASPFAFYTTDVKGRITFCNKRAVKLFGKTPELGTDLWCGFWRSYFPDGKPIPLDQCPMALTLSEGKILGNQEIIIEKPDSTRRHLVVYPQPIYDAEGKLQGAHNTLVDITEQKNYEVRDNMLSAIVDSSDDAIISRNLDGIITSWNAGAERILKYSQEEIIGKSIDMLIPVHLHKEENQFIKNILNGGRVKHFETVRKDKSGNEIPLSLTISPVKDNLGRIIGVSKVARDISEKLKGDEKQAILSAIVESSGDAIISKNLNGIIMSWNQGAEQIFGYTEKEMLGKSITTLIPEERLGEEEVIINKIKR